MPAVGPGGDADQREADVGDAGIGHQALDVELADGGEGAERHRGQGEDDDHLLPLHGPGTERPHQHPQHQPDRGDLGCARHERGHRRGGTFIDIGRPHVERHGRHLEGQARDHEHEPDQGTQRQSGLGRPQAGQHIEIEGAREAVDQGAAVQQHAGSQGTQDEIFQPGLGRAQVVAMDGRQHVDRQALQLDRHVEGEEAVGRDHHGHAERREQHEQRVLVALDLLVAHELAGQQQGARGADQDQHLEERRVAVEHEMAVEGEHAGLVVRDSDQRRHQHGQHGQGSQQARTVLLATDGTQKQQGQRAQEQDQLGRRQGSGRGSLTLVSALSAGRDRCPRPRSAPGAGSPRRASGRGTGWDRRP